LSDSLGNSQGSTSPKFSKATPMPVRAMPSLVGGFNSASKRIIPQTGMITRQKTLDVVTKTPSRADQFRKKTFEIKQH